MKFTLVLFLFCMTIGINNAQNITGKIIEAETKEPIPFAGVFLMNADSIFVASTNSDLQGEFNFNPVSPGDYFIEVIYTGFEKTFSKSFTLIAGDEKFVGILPLTVGEFSLDEVEITANNPIYTNAADRKVYHVDQDIFARSGSVSDILQNIPSVSVESEGEILLRGSGNVTFLLNGKTSGLLKNNPATFLEQIPAHTIERIEVITNPSAKFRPDGTAGIINIVTKRNVIPGFNGSVLLNASTHRRYNGNLTLNYNPGKFNIALSAGYWTNYSPRSFTDYRIRRDTFAESETTFDLRSNSVAIFEAPRASLNLDFIPDDKNSLTAFISYRKFLAERGNESSTIETDASGILNNYTTNRQEDDTESEFEATLSGEHAFRKEDHILSFEASLYEDDEMENSILTDLFTIPSQRELITGNKIHKIEKGKSFSIDYTNPLTEEIELELGYEGEFASGDLDFIGELYEMGAWKNDQLRTNRFLYNQDIHAGYATLSQAFGDMVVLGGLRAEQTNITSNLVTLDSVVPNNYFKLFPTLHLSYELADKQSLSLSYSRRINRPDPDELNPFPEYIDIRDIEAGNPNLQPEQTHAIELGYHYQSNTISVVHTAYYRYTYDAMAEISYYINDSTLLTTQENLDNKISGGLEMIFRWTPSSKMNINLSSNLYYKQIDASNLTYESDRSVVTADHKLAANFNFLTDTRLQVNANYRGAGLIAQGRSLPLYFINAGLKQDLFKKHASLTLTISDIFNTMRWKYIIDTPELYQEVTRKRKSQVVYLGFSYRFGFANKKSEEEMLFDDRLE